MLIIKAAKMIEERSAYKGAEGASPASLSSYDIILLGVFKWDLTRLYDTYMRIREPLYELHKGYGRWICVGVQHKQQITRASIGETVVSSARPEILVEIAVRHVM